MNKPLPRIATEPGRPAAETWEEQAFRAWDVLRYPDESNWRRQAFSIDDEKAAALVVWVLYRSCVARKRGVKPKHSPTPIGYYLNAAYNFVLQHEDYVQEHLLAEAPERLRRIAGKKNQRAVDAFLAELTRRAREAMEERWRECNRPSRPVVERVEPVVESASSVSRIFEKLFEQAVPAPEPMAKEAWIERKAFLKRQSEELLAAHPDWYEQARQAGEQYRKASG